MTTVLPEQTQSADTEIIPSSSALTSMWRRVILNLFWIGLAGLMVASMLSLFARSWWFADLFAHFRVQYIVVSLGLLTVSLYTRYWKTTVLILLIACGHGYVLLPYLTPISHATVPPKNRSLLVWNVLIDNTNYDPILEQIREVDADIVILFEIGPKLDNRLKQLEDMYPYQQTAPELHGFGAGVLSKSNIPRLSIQTIGEELGNSIIVRQPDGTTIVGAHCLPPVGPRYSRIRNQQLSELSEFIENQEGPVIVTGDFNISPWSPHFQDLITNTNLQDPREGRGVLSSWPKGKPEIRIPIDHILATENVGIGEFQVLEETAGSDHHPLFCRWWIEE